MDLQTILDLPFKGSREYLRLADLFPALEQDASSRYGPHAWIESVTIRRPFRRAIFVSFAQAADASGTFYLRVDDQRIPGWLVESARPVVRRIPYDSAPVEDAAETGPGFARLVNLIPGFPSIDIVISLMRMVCSQVTLGPWMICQLNLNSPLTESLPIEIRLRQSLAGRFILFDLIQMNVAIGSARVMLDGNHS